MHSSFESTRAPQLPTSIAWALLALRMAGGSLLLAIHGLPKALHWHAQLALIEDPFGLGATLTLASAVLVEVLCPVLVMLGLLTRVACLAIVGLLLVALLLVHPEWTLEQGQFGWLYVTVFGTLALSGPGPYRLGRPPPRRAQHRARAGW